MQLSRMQVLHRLSHERSKQQMILNDGNVYIGPLAETGNYMGRAVRERYRFAGYLLKELE